MTSFLDRLLGRPEPTPFRAAKAVTDIGGGWQNSVSLSAWGNTPQDRAAAYLKAYKVGWFYKAGRKIADDVSGLDWSISEGDSEEGDEQNTLPRPGLELPFESLSPIDQMQRLLERPNPRYTGRQLLRKTQIRLDFAGAACWYLEGGLLPTAIYGISPARMWPSYDRGGNLIGWVMDKDSASGGVPFDTSEILWFSTGSADDDEVWGVSVVEAVYSQVPLTDLMARHTANVLTTGGRLAGMMWPKDRALSEDEFTDAQRAWRNVASDPDAARRLLIFPEPMEYAQGASTPAEIGLPELATLNRDEILTAFPLSPYQLGVPMPGGLNSAETRREDRRDYWEGTIHPRADLLEEFIQVGLVSRYEQIMGTTYDFELEEPNLDDASSLLEKVAALRALASAGFDEKEAVSAVGLDSIKFNGIPAPDPNLATTVNDTTRQDSTQTTSKEPPATAATPAAPAPKAKGYKAREDIASRSQPRIADFLDKQRERTIKAIKASLPAEKTARKAWGAKADPDWWDAAAEDSALGQTLRLTYVDAGRNGLQVVADSLGRIVPNKSVDRIVEDLMTYGGERIRDINARTLQRLTVELAEGTRRGYSLNQLIDGVPNEGFKGITNVGFENGIGVWDDYRAEVISRTETALSYNRASLNGYKEFNVGRVEAIDGDGDPACADRNGHTFPVDEALGMADHPNGTLDWVPVEKSYHEPAQDHTAAFIDAIKSITERPQPDIHVHTTPPDVVLPTPVVNVEPPDLAPMLKALNDLRDDVKSLEPPVVNVPAPIVNLPPPIVSVKAPMVTDVRVTSMPDRAHRIIRDKQGKPTGSVVTDA